MYLIITVLTFALIEWDPKRYELVSFYSHLPLTERLSVVLLNLTLTKGLFSQYVFTGIAPGWTLTVEECFYICAPFFMLALRRSTWGILWLPVVCLSVAVLLAQTVGELNFYGLFHDLKFVLNRVFFGRCLEFFAGMGLGIYMLHERQRNPNKLVRNGGWFTFLGGALILVAMFILVMISSDTKHESTSSYLGIVTNNVFLPIPILMLFYGLLTETTWIRKILSTKLFDTLGKSSYIFYLIHSGVINILLATYVVHNSIAQFILLNLISVLLYKYVESPLHLWLKPKSLPAVSK